MTKKLGFRSKMTLAILIVAFVLVMALSLANYGSTKKRIEQDYISTQARQLQIQAVRLDEIFQQAYSLCIQMRNDRTVRQAATAYRDGAHTYDNAAVLSEVLRGFLSGHAAVNAVSLYLPDCGQVVSSAEYYVVRDVSDAANLPWAAHSDDAGTPFAPQFFRNQSGRSSQQVYAYTAALETSDGDPLGTLCVTIDERDLYYQLLDQLGSSDSAAYYILSPSGAITCAQDVSDIGTLPADVPGDLQNRVDAGEAGEGHLYTAVQAPLSGYRFLSLSDSRALTASVRSQRNTLLLSLSFVFLLLVFLSTILAKWLTRPLHQLIEAIDKVGGGDFTAQVDAAHADEFAVLSEHFNDMVVRIDQLMEENVQERTRKKQAELRALQYQIRPHFMYNTLNTILFAAKMQRNQVLADQLSAFIALLEASIQRHGAFIPLREELDLVKDYISLQKFRYFDCFAVEYDVAEETQDCYVPCLLLQPVIENAVFHGIDTRGTDTDNRIVLSAHLDGGTLCLSLRDNGKGMTEEQVARLLSEDTSEDKRRLTGIGLRNIRDRLQLYYGEDASFALTSAPGEGTTASFRLPVCHDPQQYSL